MFVKSLIFVCSVAALFGAGAEGLFFGKFGMPLHASCKIAWTFGENCGVIHGKILAQIDAWKTADNCANGGEKCLYILKIASDSEIKASHLTPVAKYSDSLSFKFQASEDGKSCSVEAYSSSDVWYAVLDKGTNYCNLRNLIDGAGLDKTNGFKEETSNSKCTQFTSANCEKY
ncbi:uncharacterized protein LOC141912300 [Tubulanus polymorphus]|uniref:uncharacterized protein LOC141912300 n=1 Tax=Tubulanus polymorphus TaxID=672921 RepID=UPI003DA2E2D3